MEKMNKVWAQPGAMLFFLLTGLLLVLECIVLVFIEKGDAVLWMSDHRSAFANVFFKYITHLGDGLLPVLIIVGTLLLSYRYALVLTLAALMQLIISQVSKRILFADVLRPIAYFPQGTLSLVEGVEVHSRFSFPSGHTLSAFSVATVFVLIFPARRGFAITAFLFATLVGLSRIYLAQHFLQDTVAGAFLGVFFTTIIYIWLSSTRWFQYPSLKRGLLTRAGV